MTVESASANSTPTGQPGASAPASSATTPPPAAAAPPAGAATPAPSDSSSRPSALSPDSAGAGKGAKPPAEEPKKGADSSAAPASEAKPLEVKLPDGVKVDEQELKAYVEVATKAKLSSEQASELASWYASRRQELATEAVSAWQKQSQTWWDELKADKDFGGQKHEENLALAREALKRVPGGQELMTALVEYGVDNLPPLVKAFAFFGRGIREDNQGSSASGSKGLSQREILDKLYPTSAHIGK